MPTESIGPNPFLRFVVCKAFRSTISLYAFFAKLQQNVHESLIYVHEKFQSTCCKAREKESGWKMKGEFYMFRIFLAEDNDSDAYHLEQCLQTWAQSTNVALSIQRSQNLTEKLAAAVQHYDALFLDIKMHGLDGLTFAKLVREKDSEIPIIFVSAYAAQYALEGYSVSAMQFLVKPVTQEGVDRCMERIREWRSRVAAPKLSIPNGPGGSPRLYMLRDILYIEAVGHYTFVYNGYAGNAFVKHRLPFKVVNALLPKPPFFNCYRSYTVNLLHAKDVSCQSIVMENGSRIPLRRSGVESFRKALLDIHREK